MERYTNKNHPKYIPGTYSIYSSAIIRHKHQEVINRYKYLAASYNDKDQLRVPRNPNHLGVRYNYIFNKDDRFEEIPDLKTRFGVILLPQPTNSINDPLNWSRKRKLLHLLVLLLVTSFTAAVSNDASAPTDSINALTGVSYDTLNNSAGVLFIAIAISTWLYAPLDYLISRKSVLLFGTLFCLFGSINYAKIQNTGDSFGSQILIGFGQGSTDAHVQHCLASVFFRHQLGSVITIYNLAYALGIYLGPLCANFISFDSDFRWVGWSGAIASGGILIIIFLFLEENSFDYSRFQFREEDLTLQLSLMQYGILSNDENNDSLFLGYYDKAWDLGKRLSPFKLPKCAEYRTIKGFIVHYFKLLLLPIKCLWFPPVIYSGVICGLQNAILSFYLTTEDTSLYDSPFNFSGSKVALMNVPCIIGSVIGCLYAGSMTDYFILWMARKKDGIVESEFRLYFAFLSGTIGAIGLLMFGFGINRNLHWRVYYVGLGFISYMFSSSNNLAMLYVMDTYQELILETLVGVAFINNMLGCIFTFACSPWLDSSGTENTYTALAVITLFIMYFAGAFIIWGKSWRNMTKKMYVDLVHVKQNY